MMIGITGGKGGTGKTVVAVNLAVAIAKSGRKVTYLDCDADCPSAHIVMGIERGERRAVRSFIPKFNSRKCKRCGKCVSVCEVKALYQLPGKAPTLLEQICNGCEACLLACPFNAIRRGEKIVGWTYRGERGGVELFSGELKPSEPLSEKIVDAVKERGRKEGKGEIFIVDTSAGAHCQVVRALEGCKMAIAVTEPTLFGIHDLKVISSVLKKLKISYKVVVNRSSISKRKVKNATMEIPYDRMMIECYTKGIPMVERFPEHPISKKFFNFAERMLACAKRK
ncbi:MAG: P-loop NTPase [Candidatus Micrarchaeia archaeon]